MVNSKIPIVSGAPIRVIFQNSVTFADMWHADIKNYMDKKCSPFGVTNVYWFLGNIA